MARGAEAATQGLEGRTIGARAATMVKQGKTVGALAATTVKQESTLLSATKGKRKASAIGQRRLSQIAIWHVHLESAVSVVAVLLSRTSQATPTTMIGLMSSPISVSSSDHSCTEHAAIHARPKVPGITSRSLANGLWPLCLPCTEARGFTAPQCFPKVASRLYTKLQIGSSITHVHRSRFP